MTDEPTDSETQKSQPRPRKKGKKTPEPVEIPVPSKGQIMRDFEKIATKSVKAGGVDDEDDDWGSVPLTGFEPVTSGYESSALST